MLCVAQYFVGFLKLLSFTVRNSNDFLGMVIMWLWLCKFVVTLDDRDDIFLISHVFTALHSNEEIIASFD